MNIQIISCGVFRTDLQAVLPGTHQSDIMYLEGGLHENPGELRRRLQEAIDRTENNHEKIIILYGVCGQGISGLKSAKSTLVIPRVHDCISLFLGSTQAYQEQFKRYPGTYYISAGWYDEQIQPVGKRLSKDDKKIRPGEDLSAELGDLEKLYGAENAEFIKEFYGSWKRNYKRSVFINTGSGTVERYRDHADALAKEFGWEYQELKGSARLILKAINATETDDDILHVPPGYITYYDSALKKIASAPPGDEEQISGVFTLLKTFSSGKSGGKSTYRYGLGIDAGGTYTDAVIYDFAKDRVISTGKALTTKWDYTIGIVRSVEQLGCEFSSDIEMISVSTTLATNAIVEGNTQPVGLMLMNMENFIPEGISCIPQSIIKGKTTIQGEVAEDINPDEIRKIADNMIKQHGVRAFAVSGYAGTINPLMEQRVKSILHKHTGMDICCGHELSGLLDFTLRANTAVFNAGIIPLLELFISNLEAAMLHLNINAPIMLVKGDGTLINTETAKLHPIETALSGPAASTAGAKYLINIPDATIIDVGGTTSDIGMIRNGRVAIVENGVRIGGKQTHVKAVDMYTLGIGGDSEIRYEKRDLTVGPRRVVPFSSLTENYNLDAVLEILEKEVNLCEESTQPITLVIPTGRVPDYSLNPREEMILELIQEGPVSVNSLTNLTRTSHWTLLPLGKLDLNQIIQRSTLTPTDIFHVCGELKLWDPIAAERITSLFSSVLGISTDELILKVKSVIKTNLSRILTQQLLLPGPKDLNSDKMTDIIDTIWQGGSTSLRISPKLIHPVIGLGAAAGFLLPDMVDALNGKLILHKYSAVANAIGAITSKVQVKRKGSIIPSAQGDFILTGISGSPSFDTLELAQINLTEHLNSEVLAQAEAAGTGNREVTFNIHDRISEDATGKPLFLERILEASITGLPTLR